MAIIWLSQPILVSLFFLSQVRGGLLGEGAAEVVHLADGQAGEWFRLVMLPPDPRRHRSCQAEIPLNLLSKFPEPALS
jgi:hypothetical protein